MKLLFSGAGLLLLLSACGNEATGEMEEMSTDELEEHVESGYEDNWAYIDVREEDEFAERYIQGFDNIPMDDVMADPQFLENEEQIVILCNTQNRSIEVGESLQEQGFDSEDITIVMGGISDYSGETVE